MDTGPSTGRHADDTLGLVPLRYAYLLISSLVMRIVECGQVSAFIINRHNLARLEYDAIIQNAPA
ncbi:hypothetical protein D1872_289150 [compost metagenome]